METQGSDRGIDNLFRWYLVAWLQVTVHRCQLRSWGLQKLDSRWEDLQQMIQSNLQELGFELFNAGNRPEFALEECYPKIGPTVEEVLGLERGLLRQGRDICEAQLASGELSLADTLVVQNHFQSISKQLQIIVTQYELHRKLGQTLYLAGVI